MANPIGNIRRHVTDNKAAYAEGAMTAMGSLALGAGRAEAAVNGLVQGALRGLAGRLGTVAGLTYGVTKAVYGMTKAWATMGTGAASKLETVQNQLRVMLKGLDAARQRVRELRDFSVATPFKMGDIVQGNRALESLSRGALTTRENLEMVGDAAAQAGVNFEDMAVYVGRLYDGLEGGRPVGEVLFRLAELGVISGRARTAIEQLQESGAGFSQVWRVVQGEFKRSAGTMAYTSQTLEGLQSTLQDAQDEMQATFSTHFIDGQKKALEAEIQVMKNLMPVVDGLGRGFSVWVTVMSNVKVQLAAWLSGLKGVAPALEFVTRLVGVLAGGITVLAGVIGASRMLGWLAGLVPAAGLAGKALSGLGGALGLLGRGLMLVTTGAPVLLAVLAVLGTMWWQHTDNVKKAAAALREYEGATDALVSKMEAQRAAIKTVDQLAGAYQETLSGLADAYRELAEAEAEMDREAAAGNFKEAGAAAKRAEAARRRVGAREEGVRALDAVDPTRLERDAFFMQNRGAMLDGQRQVERAELERRRAGMTPMARVASMEAEARELERRRGSAILENNKMERFRVERQGIGADLKKNLTAQAAAEGRGDKEALTALRKEEEELRLAEIRLAEASGSTVVALQAKLELMNRYETAAQGVRDAEVALREAGEEADETKRAEAVKKATAALEGQRRELERLAGVYSKQGLDPAKAQEMREELERRKREIAGDITNRPDQIALEQQIEQEKRNREQSKLEAAGDERVQRAGEDRGALAAAQAQIQAERERLELQRKYNQIDTEIYERRKAVLESEQRLLERKQEMARGENAAGLRAGGLNLQAQAARMQGRGAEARRLEEEALRGQEEAGRGRRVRELMDSAGLSEEAAGMQVEQEIRQARAGRALEREGGLLQSLLGQRQVVDSMQRIGGGGGVGGGPDIQDVVKRLDELIRAVREEKDFDIRL